MEPNSDSRHYNPMGTVHGGVLCDIADAAMGPHSVTRQDGRLGRVQRDGLQCPADSPGNEHMPGTQRQNGGRTLANLNMASNVLLTITCWLL